MFKSLRKLFQAKNKISVGRIATISGITAGASGTIGYAIRSRIGRQLDALALQAKTRSVAKQLEQIRDASKRLPLPPDLQAKLIDHNIAAITATSSLAEVQMEAASFIKSEAAGRPSQIREPAHVGAH